MITTLLTFALVKQLPSPFESNPKLAPSVKANLNRIYGLDRPWYEQYGSYIAGLAHGDLGKSTRPNTSSINDLVKQALPVSAQLGALAFLFASIVGVALGVFSALFANTFIDYAITVLSTALFALPIFVLSKYVVEYAPTWSIGWETPQSKVGPVLVIGLSLMPYFTRLVRASMLETLQQEYVVAARAKGLPWRRTVTRHVLRNSLIPAVTSAGPLLGFMLTGSFIIEKIHYIPGIGGQFVRSFGQPLDLNMILGTTLIVSLAVIIANLFVDIIVALLDPRISHD